MHKDRYMIFEVLSGMSEITFICSCEHESDALAILKTYSESDSLYFLQKVTVWIND